MTAPVPLILDVDTGIDDALALAFAVHSPEIELVAVTTLAGNVNVERTTANTLAVLDLLGAMEVPVHRGASHALVRPHVDAAYFHDTTGLGDAQLPASDRSPGSDRGPAAIIRHVSARPGEVTLVCLGPLTNLAIALNVAPELPTLLKALVVMGGAFRVPGNVSPHAEFNVFADPEAAAQVFAAGWPAIRVVGLDVTHQAALPKTVWEQAGQAGPSDRTAFLVSEVCRHPFAARRLPSIYLHDPLAVALAVHPERATWTRAAVSVALSEERRGQTTLSGAGSVDVAATVDGETFVDSFARTLGLPR